MRWQVKIRDADIEVIHVEVDRVTAVAVAKVLGESDLADQILGDPNPDEAPDDNAD